MVEQDNISEVERLRIKLAQEEKEFSRRMEWEEQRLKREQELIDMKLRILEEEYKRLAEDKARFEQQKAFYNRVHEFESNTHEEKNIVRGDLFFIGVDNRASAKKRYKDLIKIYHPDNAAGDTTTIQEINEEYEKLCTTLDA